MTRTAGPLAPLFIESRRLSVDICFVFTAFYHTNLCSWGADNFQFHHNLGGYHLMFTTNYYHNLPAIIIGCQYGGMYNTNFGWWWGGQSQQFFTFYSQMATHTFYSHDFTTYFTTIIYHKLLPQTTGSWIGESISTTTPIVVHNPDNF